MYINLEEFKMLNKCTRFLKISYIKGFKRTQNLKYIAIKEISRYIK